MTAFELKCVEDIKPSIYPSSLGYSIPVQGLRFHYRVHGEVGIQYITLATDIEAAEFLRMFGKVYWYSVKGGEVVLYSKVLKTIEVAGRPVQKIELDKMDRHCLTFTADELAHYAAVNEFHKKGSIIGLARAKIIRLFDEVLHRMVK